jgi:hypothetical protein
MKGEGGLLVVDRCKLGRMSLDADSDDSIYVIKKPTLMDRGI